MRQLYQSPVMVELVEMRLPRTMAQEVGPRPCRRLWSLDESSSMPQYHAWQPRQILEPPSIHLGLLLSEISGLFEPQERVGDWEDGVSLKETQVQ